MKSIVSFRGSQIVEGHAKEHFYEMQVHNGVNIGKDSLKTVIEIRSTEEPSLNILMTWIDLADALKVMGIDIESA